MNTDQFNDNIRRKLESIRPDFSEKDWARMQATLQHATPPLSGSSPAYQPLTGSAWSTQPWLLAAAAVSTVVLISLATWQRAQISDLRQTVARLSQQQKTQPQPTPAPNAVVLPSDRRTAQRNQAQSGPTDQPANRSQPTADQPDTVYITRYVAVPARPVNSSRGQTAQPSTPAPDGSSIGRTDRTRSLADAQPQQRQTDQATITDRSNDAPDKALPVADNPTNSTNNRPESASPPTRRVGEKTATQPVGQPENDAPGQRKGLSAATVTIATTAATRDNQTTSGSPTTATPAGSAVGGVAGETGQPMVTYALAARPVTMEVIDWNEALSRQAQRMRPVRITTVGGGAAPVSQPVNRVAFGFRLGAGGEVLRSVRSGGLLTELLIGKHLTLGAGLGLASFAGGTFLTDVEFDRGKPKKFRRDYIPGRGIDPRSDILNIGTHTERVQIPISLGYRIPVSQTFSLLPSVGTTLGLQSKEFVTFTYRQPLRSYETASYRIPHPVDLLNNLTFGAGVEWQRNHWVWQAGPVLTVPLVADANWPESPSIGLRARLFYQF